MDKALILKKFAAQQTNRDPVIDSMYWSDGGMLQREPLRSQYATWAYDTVEIDGGCSTMVVPREDGYLPCGHPKSYAVVPGGYACHACLDGKGVWY